MSGDNVVVTVNCPHCGALNDAACPVLHKIPQRVIAEPGDNWGLHDAKSYSACERCGEKYSIRWWF